MDDIVPLSRFSLSYLTNTNFMSLVDLSPIFAFSNVNTKNRALSRPSHEPFSIQWMVPSLSPYFVCPCWNYHSLQPGTNPWGLSFTQHNFFARTGHGGPVLSGADLTLRSMSVMSRSGWTDITVSLLRFAAFG